MHTHTIPARAARWARRGATITAVLLFFAACVTQDPNDPAGENPPGENPPGENPPPPPGPSASYDTIFYESFESGNLNAWDDGPDSRHRVITDATLARHGTRLLEVTYPQNATGGFLTKFFMPGYDSAYVSYNVYLQSGWRGGTKLIALYGSRIDNMWSAHGQAGVCPNGTNFFASMVITEPVGDPGLLRLYSYFPAMRREPDGVTCWGNSGDATTTYHAPLTLEPGRWHRIEQWVKINTPGQTNSVQQFWLNGQLKADWRGISFRTSDILRINSFQLTFSVAWSGAPQTQIAYIDDVLVTTARPAP